jgi:hypothetical protein
MIAGQLVEVATVVRQADRGGDRVVILELDLLGASRLVLAKHLADYFARHRVLLEWLGSFSARDRRYRMRVGTSRRAYWRREKR